LPGTEAVPDQKRPPSPYPDKTSNHLEHRLLHKLLVVLNSPTNWPGWLIGGAALFAVASIASLWWLLEGREEALYLAVALIVFILVDALILICIRRWRLSFGPVGPQLFTLELPRLALALAALTAAIWLGSALVLVSLVAVNFVASLALMWGALFEPQRLGLSNVSFVNGSQPTEVPLVRLLHISDLHVERLGLREEKLLHVVRSVSPDLILLTGDYVNLSYVDDPIAHTDARRFLAALSSIGGNSALGGVYAVLGSPPVDRNSISLFDGLPIRLLRNETVTIELPASTNLSSVAGEPGPQLVLVGLDCSHDPASDAERLAAVVAQAPPDACRVLLYHSPELMPVAPEFGINLYLCGHTHGGQVRLPFYGALVTASTLGKRFEMGYYRLDNTHLYVSRGFGFEGMGAPRVRFLCPPEITLVSIQSPEANHGSCDKTPLVW
jgi:predicted MPP superfamily phosphohydrolase